jgi:hypothetical protein
VPLPSPAALAVAYALHASAPPPNLVLPFAQLEVALVPLTKMPAAGDVTQALGPVNGCDIKVDTLSRADFPRLTFARYGRNAGLSREDFLVAQAASNAAYVSIKCPARDWKKLRDAYAAIANAAQKTGCALYDPSTIATFSPAALRQERIDGGWSNGVPVAHDHVRVNKAAQGDVTFTITTVGLPRLGSPNLTLRQVKPSAAETWASIVELLAQRLAEGAMPEAGGHFTLRIRDVKEPTLKAKLLEQAAKPEGSLTLGFVWSDPANGGMEGTLELVFPGLHCASPDECRDLAAAQLFGG